MKVVLATAAASFLAPLVWATDYRAGYAQADISPTAEELATGKVFMGAYGLLGTRGAAVGVHDPVWVRALAIDDGTTPLVIAIGDLPGASTAYLDEIRNGVAARVNM